jgi:hypothetical protein
MMNRISKNIFKHDWKNRRMHLAASARSGAPNAAFAIAAQFMKMFLRNQRTE